MRDELRLATRGADAIDVVRIFGVRRRISLRRGREDDRLAVGPPRRIHLVPRPFGDPSGEAGLLHQIRAGEKVVRAGIRVEALYDEMDLHVVEPAIPVPDREAVEGADFVLAVLTLLRHLLVRLVVERSGIDDAGKENRLTVRPE